RPAGTSSWSPTRATPSTLDARPRSVSRSKRPDRPRPRRVTGRPHHGPMARASSSPGLDARTPVRYRRPPRSAPPDERRTVLAEPIQTTLEEGIPLSEVTFCVVDLETTGGPPKDCRITEVGAVTYRGGELLGAFQALVDPGASIPAFIAQL